MLGNWTHRLLFTAVILGCSCSPAGNRSSTKQRPQPDGKNELQAYSVTPVQGPSWLKHLGLQISQTRIGQMGGVEQAPPTPRKEPAPAGEAAAVELHSVLHRIMSKFLSNPGQASRTYNQQFLVTGADLYRLDCQSCHGPDGKGAPPEINSLIGPVQGTSPS